MKEYIYPAVFHSNSDGSYTVTFPDLSGCISEGRTIGEAMSMAESALTQWIEYLLEKKCDIPSASDLKATQTDKGEFASLIKAALRDNRAVRRTVSIPKWMDDKASRSGLSLSRVLQTALNDRLNP